MFEIKEKPKMVERALLVGVYRRGESEALGQSLLEELGELTTTLGVSVVDQMLVRIHQPQPKFYVGSGKAEEIIEHARELEADVIIFDNELSPAQQRSWEAVSKLCVIDRHEVILDIFAQRAQTREARLQVALARMEYSLPRLTRAWTHLSRQGGASGGLGAKGEGETQLETDRRLVRKRIDKLKAELVEVRAQRATQRKQRERKPVPHAAIVGYTNAGKSSLLKRLTAADVLVEDKLFATLDTTTRRITLANNRQLLLTDTVGFVRNLPHDLVDAFKATLEEAVLADFLVHVIDASQPEAVEFHTTTMGVLRELGADQKPILTVFNKIDRAEPEQLHPLRLEFPEAVFVSVKDGVGLEHLMERLILLTPNVATPMTLLLPHTEGELVALLHEAADVHKLEYLNDGVRIEADVPEKLQHRATPYAVPKPEKKAEQPKPAESLEEIPH